MMYHAYQAHSDTLWPLRAWARHAAPMLLDPGLSLATGQASRHAAAACRVYCFSRRSTEGETWAPTPFQ